MHRGLHPAGWRDWQENSANAAWEVDTKRKTTRVRLAHELLARCAQQNPLPGVNGLKQFGKTLYASNTQKQLLLRIPIKADVGVIGLALK